MKFSITLYRFVALLLASNYFAFQVELFEDEYEENHPKQADVPSFSHPSITWETFDKDCAQKAFTIDPLSKVEFLFSLQSEPFKESLPYKPLFDIRDKSPPTFHI